MCMTRLAFLPFLILGCSPATGGGGSSKDDTEADTTATGELPSPVDGEQVDTGSTATQPPQWTMATDVPSEVVGKAVRDFGGFGGGTLFLCGDAGIFRLRAPDGTWTKRDVETDKALRACTARSASELVTVGDGGKVWSWTEKDEWGPLDLFEQSPGLRDVWLDDAGIITVVGVQGSIYRFEDLVWKDERVAGVTATLQALWASADGTLAIAGGEGTLLARIGGKWAAEALPPDPPGTPAGNVFTVRSIWGPDASHVWAVGSLGRIAFRGEAGTWTYQDSQWFATAFNTVFGLSATDVLVAADKGQVRRFDGTAWQIVEMKTPKKTPAGQPWPPDQVVPNPPGSLDFVGAWASEPLHLWLMESSGKLVQYNADYKL